MAKKVSDLTGREVMYLHDQLKTMQIIGRSAFNKYQAASSGEHIEICIRGICITVRKGTPDLRVAISCLTGEFDMLRYLLPKTYTGHIVDAGGYIGTSAIALSLLFPNAQISAIEPSNENLSILKKNIQNFNNINFVHGALVGSDTTHLTLKDRGTGEWGYSVVAVPRDNQKAKSIQQVPAYRISEIVTDIGQIGLLKLDVEGGEQDLFEQDMEVLRTIPIVFAELHDRIAARCTELFFEFSRERKVIKGEGEKYLSLK